MMAEDPTRPPLPGAARRKCRARRGAAAIATAAALFLAGCASQREAMSITGSPAVPPRTHLDGGQAPAPNTRPAKPGHDSARYQESGVASWYGKRYHGRRTASGQRFDMNALTAAHRTLPFGTRVEVTNLANGRSVVLVINDRGPFIKGRVIDVSRRGAANLGFLRKGLARVRMRVLEVPDA
jgi:rare lipoprotein A